MKPRSEDEDSTVEIKNDAADNNKPITNDSTSSLTTTTTTPTNNDEEEHTVNWRTTVGNKMHYISDIINDNLIAARYGTAATIALLTAYGFANSPLFFRFKTVSDIPSKLMERRMSLV
jgi:hypothetical protein